MTKKDYIKIAECLKQVANKTEQEAHGIIVEALCDVFQADNSRFNRKKFTDYIYG